MSGTIKPVRIENPGFAELAQKLAAGGYAKLFLAEGDSWFDIYTPAPLNQPNLLDALRTPWKTAVVDLSEVGATAKDVATPPQSTHTRALLDKFEFNALFLSAGGNDIKDAIIDALLRSVVHQATGGAMPLAGEMAAIAAKPAEALPLFHEAIDHIVAWIGLRDLSFRNRNTPILLHGYEYLQPRPAGARITQNGAVIRGPWAYPALAAAGKTDAEMRQMAHDVIDTFNQELAARVAGIPNVHYIDLRNSLVIAAPATDARSNDWMDEIHPTPEGFAKLAAKHWNDAIETHAL